MQGFNMGRYVPPELEGQYSANQVSGKHPLGNRARKAGQGILTVRFEMPFAVWCSTCPKPTIIGQGVRFNAEKKKAGNYHSTPIWAFRMKHLACGGWIEIQTDPKNTDYVVTEGGKRRDTGEDKVREGDIEIRSEEEKRRLQEDAFAALEVKIGDRQQADADEVRIEELYAAQDRDWDDPYAVNKRVRKGFRTERKELERKAGLMEGLKARMSLGIELVEETDEDRRRAATTDFGPNRDTAVDLVEDAAATRPLFTKPSRATSGRQAKDTASSSLRESLTRTTRSNLNLFGDKKRAADSTVLPGVKRKRTEGTSGSREQSKAHFQDDEPTTVKPPQHLVEYDSD